MREILRTWRVTAVGCEEAGRLGLMDTSACCEICHSAERYVPCLPLGPCRASLPGGGEALVCCTGKKQLLDAVAMVAIDGAPGTKTKTLGG